MALFDFLKPVTDAIQRALGPFGKLFDLISKFWTNLTNLRANVTKLVESIVAEVIAWKSFKEDIQFRTRVINVPKAIEKTQELIDQVSAAWRAIVDLWKDVSGKLKEGGDPAAEAEEAVHDIESGGLKEIIQKFPKLAKGAEKLIGFIAIVADALESIINAVDDLQTIVDTIKALREEIETGSTIFLQNKNPRKTLKLKDGGSIKIRVGSLHSS